MNIFITFLMVSAVMIQCQIMNSTNVCVNERNFRFGRRRRHLTFPDGSSVILTISLVKAFMTHAPSGWNIALEIDVIYPLPDEKYTNTLYRRKLHHRQKREFWEKLEAAIDFHNLNGHACILRSVCEAKTNLAPPGTSLVHDILRAVFTASIQEEDFKAEMQGSYDELSDTTFCDKNNDCPFSIFDFVLALRKENGGLFS